ncbi:MAG: hypothetical protein WB952_04230 [Terriglobales bacterium]
MVGGSLADHEKAGVRALVFHHLAGIVLAPTVKALCDRKVFDLFKGPSFWTELDEIVEQTHGNRGYLRVALRLLVCFGWLEQRTNHRSRPAYSLTPEGVWAVRLAPPLYEEAVSFIPKALFLEDFLFGSSDEPVLPSLQGLAARAQARWGLGAHDEPAAAKVSDQIRKHLDGLLIGPAMVALARGGVLAQIGQEATDPHRIAANSGSLSCIFDLLATQGWIQREHGLVGLTACGQYAAQIASSYGVTVSYLPLFDVVSTLLFGNPRIPRMNESGVELLVNRGMNVWGSGGAHKTYFKKVDEIMVEIFNRPLERQPQGICDMGCGDGSFLEHLYFVVKDHTARGAVLDQHPLIMVGADFNKVARRISKQTLRKAGIPTFHVIGGDINRPAQLASDLEELGLDIHDLLHVRSFLDHNRPYLPPANYAGGSRTGRCTGAFAHFGEEIPADVLEENLLRHLRRWAPYVGRFGLLVLELHTLPPAVTADNLEKTPAVAYDGTHGFSDQYLVELPIFLESARQAGLQADRKYQCKFPPSELATVSINFFTTGD